MPSLEQLRRQKRLAAENAGNKAAATPDDKVDSASIPEPVVHVAETKEEPVAEVPELDAKSDNDTVDNDIPASGEETAADEVREEPVEEIHEEPEPESPVQSEEEPVFEPEVPDEPEAPVELQEDELSADDVELEEAALSEQPEVVEPKKSVGKEKPVQREKKKRGRKPKERDMGSDGTVRVDLPTRLVSMMRAQIPDSMNNTEAVAAWVYAKSDKTVDVSDSIRKLAACYTGDQMSNLVKDVSERLAVLDSRTMKMQMLTDGRVQEMWYMIAYLMLERMDALAKTHMKDLDITLPVFETLKAEVNAQFRKVRNRQQLQDGREIYRRKVQGRSDNK